MKAQNTQALNVTVTLDGTLLGARQQEWAQYLAHPTTNPLLDHTDFAAGFTLENDLCLCTQNPAHFDGLPYSGLIVTKRPCETVFDLTPDEAAAVHALLAEVRAHLETTVKPNGYTVGWNVYPAGGQHVPHVHLHVIPRWNADVTAGVGVRYVLKAAARAASA